MQEKKKENKVKIIRWTNMELECFYGSYVEAVAYAKKKSSGNWTGLHNSITKESIRMQRMLSSVKLNMKCNFIISNLTQKSKYENHEKD